MAGPAMVSAFPKLEHDGNPRESPMTVITSENYGHLAHIRLNRPDQENRFTMQMTTDIGRAFTEADDDPGIRCMLVSANGADFCCGADVTDILPAWKVGKNPIALDQVNPWGVVGRRRRKPLVTVVHGRCFNGGLELALASDICIAADSARFAFEEVQFGMYPFAGGLFRFVRAAGRSDALRYSLTAEEFSAADAFRMSVVSAVKPAAEALAHGLKIASRISEAPPLALEAALAQLQAWSDGGDVAGFACSVSDVIRLLNTQDATEALHARMQNRAPVFVGR
jgi:enoyl-CoA hydratase